MTKRKSTELYAEYNPENEEYVIHDRQNDRDLLVVPDNGRPHDYRRLAGRINIDDDDTGISETISIDNRDENRPIIFEVDFYNSIDSGSDTRLEVVFEGLGDGHGYVLKDEAGNFDTPQTAQSEIVLIEPTATTVNDSHSGQWTMQGRTRPVITGNGGPRLSEQGKYLDKTLVTDDLASGGFDITIQTAAERVSLQMSIWEGRPRRDLPLNP